MPCLRVRPQLATGAVAAVLAALALVAAPAASAAEEQVVVDVLKVVDGEYVVETTTVPRQDAADAVDELVEAPDVVAAGPQVVYQPQGSPDPFWDADGPQVASRVTDVWPRTRGAGQVVAVLDTGVDSGHPDLAGALVRGTDTVGGAVDLSHGTGVAGVVAARADNGIGSAGMAPEARIMPVRVCDTGGCPSASIARGILWAADHGADVINMSLAGPGYSDVTAVAVRYALDKGISVVASSGNDGEVGNPVMYPAANSGVIAVSATTPVGAAAAWAVHGWQADIATVGESVLMPSPGGGYVNGSGTSFSGPAVAGAVALLRASHPGISTEQVQAALQAGADSSGTWDRAWGAGRLDVPAAVTAADRGSSTPTVNPSSGRLDVTWPAAPGASSYAVRVDGVVRATVSGTSAEVTGLTDGTQVAVDVQPSNAARGRAVLATVGPAAPAPPVLHSASLGGSSTSATLSLSVSAATARSGSYALVRDGVSLGSLPLTLDATPRTVTVGIGPMPTQQTRWQLRAADDLGRTSADSNAVTTGTATPAPPPAPTGLAGRADGTKVLLTWDDVGTAYSYRVTVGGSVVASPQTAGAALTAPAGEARTYDVVVVDAWGQTGPAASVSVTPTDVTVPGAPGPVTATGEDRKATVSWAAAAPNGSPVIRYTVTAFPGGASATTTGARAATVTGLTNGTAYTFTVTASNAAGTGPASGPSAAVTPRGDPIDDAHRATGGSSGPLGAPVGGRYATAGNGLTQAFQYGRVHWSPATGAFAVYGEISKAYDPLRGESGVLGYPVGGRYPTPGNGWTQAFQFGRVHTSPTTGAFAVYGDVSKAYDPLRGESGVLGYPVGSRYATAGGGVTQAFQFGRIHTSPTTGAHAVYGDISRAYDPLRGESGVLGYPVGSRYATAGGGVTQAFQFGRIHTSPTTGAHAVYGDISRAYDPLRGESGRLGYPLGGQYAVPGGVAQEFQYGRIAVINRAATVSYR